MNTAVLHSGRLITASEYNPEKHGSRLYCIDKDCKTNVIFVSASENTVPFFKTTGKSEQSMHTNLCGFYKKLTFEESIRKVEEYQEEHLMNGLNETIIRISLNKIDPDYEPRSIEKEEKKRKDPNEVRLKQENTTPKSVSSLKSIVKLLTSYEPDVLAGILVNIRGNKIPLSDLVISHEKAHQLAWSGQADDNLSYFVYGNVQNIIRREKVYYINFESINNIQFSLVVFDKYFKYFTYTDKQLIGKKILAYGHRLKKNEYMGKNKTELVIKSNQYIEILK